MNKYTVTAAGFVAMAVAAFSDNVFVVIPIMVAIMIFLMSESI